MIDGEHFEQIASEHTWALYRQRIVERANEQMRVRYFSSDANIGSEILKRRRKGLSPQNLFMLQQGWSPIAWERKPGLHFEISELSMAALGESGLDPEIDQMMVDVAEELLAEDADGILTELIQDLITGDGENYEVVE